MLLAYINYVSNNEINLCSNYFIRIFKIWIWFLYTISLLFRHWFDFIYYLYFFHFYYQNVSRYQKIHDINNSKTCYKKKLINKYEE